MANTLKFGNGNWATKEGSALAYNDLNSNYKPLPFDFSRASKATVINKDGLIEEVGSGEPRIDYKDDSKGALLLEPQRSNLITYSEAISNTIVKSGNYADNFAISPDGTQNATKLTATNTDPYFYQDLSFSAASYTASIYVKGIGNSIGKNFQIRLANNIYTDAIPSEWTRFEYTVTTPSGTASVGLEIPNPAVIGDEVLVWGWQLEEGSYATSYIPTSGQVNGVTRLADDIDTDFGTILPLNGEVSVYIEMLGQPSDVINTTGKVVSVNFDSLVTGNSYISLNFNGTNWRARVQGATGSNFVSFDVDQTETIKALFVLRPTSYALYANGSLIGSETRTYSGTAPNINEISNVTYLMQSEKFGITRNKDLRVYNTALSNAEAIALTTL